MQNQFVLDTAPKLLAESFALCRVPFLGDCIVDWGKYPDFSYPLTQKKYGWRVHSEVVKDLIYVIPRLHIQHGDLWYLTDINHRTLEIMTTTVNVILTATTKQLQRYINDTLSWKLKALKYVQNNLDNTL